MSCAVLVHSQVDSWAIKDHPLNANFISSECRLSQRRDGEAVKQIH